MDGIPDTFPIIHDDYHARHIGTLADGRQFFLTTPFVPAIGGVREMTLTGFFSKDPISVPILLDLNVDSVVSIGIFDTVDPLVVEVVVYDVQ